MKRALLFNTETWELGFNSSRGYLYEHKDVFSEGIFIVPEEEG